LAFLCKCLRCFHLFPGFLSLSENLAQHFHEHTNYTVHQVGSRRALNRLLRHHAAHFQQKGGLIYLIYSLVLTRGPRQIFLEMERWGSLIVDNLGFCGQPLVNLLTIGRRCDALLLCGRCWCGIFSSSKHTLHPNIQSARNVNTVSPLSTLYLIVCFSTLLYSSLLLSSLSLCR
jgi:Deubiquitinating enzyme MINDY-3/4, conserved domain